MLVEHRHSNAPAAAEETALPIRIITHNIRYATKAPFRGEEPWAKRCPRLCAQLVFTSLHPTSTFICLQEVLHGQLLDILGALRESNGDWAYIGVGRDDGKMAGEYSPIFYRTSVWEVNGWSTVWLSPTPDRPSKGWDAASTRILTAGSFTHIATKRKIGVMSTHLDDQGVVSRKRSAEMIRDLLESSNSKDQVPVLLGGDFNSPPDDGAYKVLTARESLVEDVGIVMDDAKRHGNAYTFTGFTGAPKDRSRIDFIFCSKAKPDRSKTYAVQSFGVLENRFEDGIYLSDHRAVVADLLLKWTS